MNLNINKQFIRQNTLCRSCNKEIPFIDYQQHKDKCYFRQTFQNSHKSQLEKENIFIRLDPNYSSHSSMKTKTLDNLEKNKEDRNNNGYFNINAAVVTFGPQKSKDNQSKEFEANIKNHFEKESQKIKQTMNNNPVNYARIFGIENRLNDHNSFMNVIIQSLWSMKKMRNFILNEIKVEEYDLKNAILFDLKAIFTKIDKTLKGDVISLKELRKSLGDAFQSRRKFLPNHPDDAIDFYFAIINSFHSFGINTSLNEIKDSSCNMKCAAHKYLFMDISRKDQCECKGVSKRLYSYHNYILNIPLKRIINKIDNEKLIQFKGKLLNLFKALLINIKTNCPEKGTRCEINKTQTFYNINQEPDYLTLSLQEQDSIIKPEEILKTIIIIPKHFNISILFNDKRDKCSYYALLGLVCINTNNHYTSVNRNGNIWVYTEDERITRLTKWADVASFLLKRSERPIMLFYEKIEEVLEEDVYLTNEEINQMNNYCRNMNNLKSMYENRFRPYEELVKFEDEMGEENNSNKNIRDITKGQDESEIKNIQTIDKTTLKIKPKAKIIERDQPFSTIEPVFQLKKNQYKNNFEIDSGPNLSSLIQEKEKFKNGQDILNRIKNSRDILFKIQGNSSNSIDAQKTSTDSKDFATLNKEINLPKQMQNKAILIQDEYSKDRIAYKPKIKANDKIINSNLPEEELSKKVNEEKWACLVCGLLNNIKHYKCLKCNNKNYEILEKMLKKDILAKDVKIPIKENKFLLKNIIGKAHLNSEKNTPKNSNFSQNDSKEKSPKIFSLCICHKLIDNKINTLFNNNVCRICGSKKVEKLHKNQNEILNIKFRSSERVQARKLSVPENKKSNELKLKDENVVINNYIENDKHKLKMNTKTDSKSFGVIKNKESIVKDYPNAATNQIKKDVNKYTKVASSNSQP